MIRWKSSLKRSMALVLLIVMCCGAVDTYGIAQVISEGQEVTMQGDTISYAPDVELPDNDILYEGYVDKLFYGGISTYGISARDRLETDEAKSLYDALKDMFEKIANGSLESTVITLTPEIVDAKFSFNNMTLDEAGDAFWAQFDMTSILEALLHDCPYELYWFDKTIGMSYGCSMSAMGFGPTYAEVTIVNPSMTFAVAGNYQATNYDGSSPKVDKGITSKASKALENAQQIVSKNAALSDYDKLIKYKEEICDLVTYDHDAASGGFYSIDNSPWQLINVFDGDTSTNVVCEGYSKAFQYLYDISEFSFAKCYTVTGKMTGATGSGGHMWNIVTMDDGKNYLVDVTNSDLGTIGQNGGLMLAGTTGSITSGYTFRVSSNDIVFKYDEDMMELWGSGEESILLLSDMDYDPEKKSDISETEYLYGDANGDTRINVMDAVLMKKHIAGFTGLSINLDACDVNLDTRINVMDAVMVLKYIAGFDVVLGK